MNVVVKVDGFGIHAPSAGPPHYCGRQTNRQRHSSSHARASASRVENKARNATIEKMELEEPKEHVPGLKIFRPQVGSPLISIFRQR